MTDAHTKGPWVFVEENAGLMTDHGYGILYGEPGAGGWEKNLFVSVGCSENVVRALGVGAPEANARLIAAAPDLLEACRAGLYVAEAEGANATAAIIRAAILKATSTEQGERG